MRSFGPMSTLAATIFIVSAALAQTPGTTLPNGETVVDENRSNGAKLVVGVRNDTLVGVWRLDRDGKRTSLSAAPTPATGKPFECSAGQQLVCYEDKANQMSVCVCGGGGRGSTIVGHTTVSNPS